jgi:hypothetical protein
MQQMRSERKLKQEQEFKRMQDQEADHKLKAISTRVQSAKDKR